MTFTLRQLIKSPGFSVIALLTLALGIGVTTTAFTVLNRLLLQSLPFHDAKRLVQIWTTSSQSQSMSTASGDYFGWKEQAESFERIALYYINYQSSFVEPGKPAARTISMAVTADFFPMMGITPVIGRSFTAEDETQHLSELILSAQFWQRQFASDPSVIGRTIRANSGAFTIIGVAPPSLDDRTLFSGRVDFWTLDHAADNRTLRESGWYQAAARLKPGVTVQQAQAEMTAIAARFAKDFPKTNADRGFKVIPYPTDSMGEIGARLVWLIMALAVTVLLIACVNLANLQLVRTTGRSREIAIRLALGSSRARIMRLLLSESLLLSLAGGALGLLVAKWANIYVALQLQLDMPLDFRVIAFAFLAAAITGALFGAMPAWQATRADVNKGLKQSARGSTSDRSRHRLRQTLIVVEIALALTLLAGAGYFVKGIHRLTNQDRGWHAENVVIGNFSLPHERFGEQGDERSYVFSERFRTEVLKLPGLDQLVYNSTPAFGLGNGMPFVIDGVPPPPAGKEPLGFVNPVSPGYFSLYGIRLLQGRDFVDTDRPDRPRVGLVNESLAKKYWPNESPIGKRLGSPDPANPNWIEIIGVVSDVALPPGFPATWSNFQIYTAFAQNSHRFLTFSVHAVNDPRAHLEDLRRVFAQLEPEVAISLLDTVPNLLAMQLSGLGLVRRLLVEIAVLGLLLAAVGIYGVVANLAVERTQEVGIRMALGAQPADVRWLFLRGGFRLALIGTVLGLACAFGLIHVLTTTLSIVPGNDPWVVIAVAALLVVVTLLACWLPARRATKVDPVIALRAE